MPRRASRRWLTDYQLGTICGAILVGIAFAAALSTVPRPESGSRSEEARHVKSQGYDQETFWQSALEPTAVFTLALVIVGGIQAALFFWQLNYMREGLEDAALAAKAARDAAAAAAESNKISRELFLAEQRPWLSVDVIPVSDFIYSTDRANITIRYTIRNMGKTPAINANIFPPFANVDQINIPRVEAMRHLMRSPSPSMIAPMGVTVFPGEAIVENKVIAVFRSGIDDIATRDQPHIMPHIFIGVQYTFLGATVKPETGYFVIIATVNQSGEERFIPIDYQNIPKDKIRLVRFPTGSIAT